MKILTIFVDVKFFETLAKPPQLFLTDWKMFLLIIFEYSIIVFTFQIPETNYV